MKNLLGVVGDSDVRVNDTEVGEGAPLTSPFIEGIWKCKGGATADWAKIPNS